MLCWPADAAVPRADREEPRGAAHAHGQRRQLQRAAPHALPSARPPGAGAGVCGERLRRPRAAPPHGQAICCSMQPAAKARCPSVFLRIHAAVVLWTEAMAHMGVWCRPGCRDGAGRRVGHVIRGAGERSAEQKTQRPPQAQHLRAAGLAIALPRLCAHAHTSTGPPNVVQLPGERAGHWSYRWSLRH
jgi:hypothetical protein